MEQLYLCVRRGNATKADGVWQPLLADFFSRMKVAVVTSTPLFVEGGHLVVAPRALVQALVRKGTRREWC